MSNDTNPSDLVWNKRLFFVNEVSVFLNVANDEAELSLADMLVKSVSLAVPLIVHETVSSPSPEHSQEALFPLKDGSTGVIFSFRNASNCL